MPTAWEEGKLVRWPRRRRLCHRRERLDVWTRRSFFEPGLSV